MLILHAALERRKGKEEGRRYKPMLVSSFMRLEREGRERRKRGGNVTRVCVCERDIKRAGGRRRDEC